MNPAGAAAAQQLALFDRAGAAEPAPDEAPREAAAGFRHPQATHELLLDGHRVAYLLRRARRRSIGFVVGAEGLAVSAPRWVRLADVEDALRSKGAWVLRKLQEQRERAHQQLAARVVWGDGAEFPFLGQPVRVKLDTSVTGAQFVPPEPGSGQPAGLRVGLPATAAPAQVRDAVQAWLQRQARRVFEARCQHYAPAMGVTVRRLSLSSAATRWGSASASGAIRLNWRLIHFSESTIDYVVVHELAHLIEMNHSQAFWQVVREALPGFEDARAPLRHTVLPSWD
ncbi:M48 family metallopeptidase [Aquincola tertiaricarbonis]|uniref:M48 family metallopeptidase n=1 Tax=Aquincola tertiaricarbonis TaxID=391953 RepID=A0ABY4S9F7_AQUTE|nr:SprT family zinc-dependent metalloprotease [Aquincola tertiaricarbonis]URI09628.1 M48 family metallopeptidase [Aquincola tertiaricarbonis]